MCVRKAFGRKEAEDGSGDFLNFIHKQSVMVIDAAKVRFKTERDKILNKLYERISKDWPAKLDYDEMDLKLFFSRLEELIIGSSIVM